MLLLMCLISGTSVLNNRMLAEENKILEHRHMAIESAMETGKLVAELERDKSGFLLKGEKAFLSSYTRTKDKLALKISTLKKMVSGSQEQAKRLGHIEKQISLWHEEVLSSETDIRRKMGNGQPLEDIVTLTDSQISKKIRIEVFETLDAFIRAEADLLEKQKSRSTMMIRKNTMMILTVTLIAVLLSVIVNFLIARHAEQYLRKGAMV